LLVDAESDHHDEEDNCDDNCDDDDGILDEEEDEELVEVKFVAPPYTVGSVTVGETWKWASASASNGGHLRQVQFLSSVEEEVEEVEQVEEEISGDNNEIRSEDTFTSEFIDELENELEFFEDKWQPPILQLVND